MWKAILIGIDNSLHSLWGMDTGVVFGKAFGSKITACHVYAVKLHDSRFKAMEYTLPDRYLKDGELEHQREVHNLLIEKGMQVISDSYLDIAKKKCEAKGIPFKGLSLEGKNYKRLVEEGNTGDYDLIILGSHGVGATKESLIGSVALRSARLLKKDLLIIKNERLPEEGDKVVACIDGSPYSYGGLLTGIELAKKLNLSLHAVAVYDPYFHYVMFNGIAKVLNEEGAKVFRFKEQEELHEKIIDDGLKKIYDSYLNIAKEFARKEGLRVETHLLSGKAYEEILKFADEKDPYLLITGRLGSHSEGGMEIGSHTENLLLKTRTNILISHRRVLPPKKTTTKEQMKWTEDATKQLERVPSFVKGMASGAIENYARERGYTVVTYSVIEDALKELMPGHLEKLKKEKGTDLFSESNINKNVDNSR